MNVQRKRIQTGRTDNNVTEIPILTTNMSFDDAQAVNVHGVNITMGVTPAGPDETLVGRWYVAMLPSAVAGDTAVRSAWLANFNTITTANDFLDSSEYIWGTGSIVCGEQSTFQHTFNPNTSRNVMNGAQLFVFFVADAVSGVVDDWDAAATISLFTS